MRKVQKPASWGISQEGCIIRDDRATAGFRAGVVRGEEVEAHRTPSGLLLLFSRVRLTHLSGIEHASSNSVFESH